MRLQLVSRRNGHVHEPAKRTGALTAPGIFASCSPRDRYGYFHRRENIGINTQTANMANVDRITAAEREGPLRENGTSMEMAMNPQCCVCKTEEGLSRCVGCNVVFYCGRNHQTGHWRKHKKACKNIKTTKTKLDAEIISLTTHLALPPSKKSPLRTPSATSGGLRRPATTWLPAKSMSRPFWKSRTAQPCNLRLTICWTCFA